MTHNLEVAVTHLEVDRHSSAQNETRARRRRASLFIGFAAAADARLRSKSTTPHKKGKDHLLCCGDRDAPT